MKQSDDKADFCKGWTSWVRLDSGFRKTPSEAWLRGYFTASYTNEWGGERPLASEAEDNYVDAWDPRAVAAYERAFKDWLPGVLKKGWLDRMPNRELLSAPVQAGARSRFERIAS